MFRIPSAVHRIQDPCGNHNAEKSRSPVRRNVDSVHCGGAGVRPRGVHHGVVRGRFPERELVAPPLETISNKAPSSPPTMGGIVVPEV